MKKLFRALMVLMVVAMTVLTAGCADEEKYNALKRDTIEIRNEYITNAQKIPYPLVAKATDPRRVRAAQLGMDLLKKYKAQYDKKIIEVGKAASGSTKLENDFKYFKRDEDEYWNNRVETTTKFLEEATTGKSESRVETEGLSLDSVYGLDKK